MKSKYEFLVSSLGAILVEWDYERCDRKVVATGDASSQILTENIICLSDKDGKRDVWVFDFNLTQILRKFSDVFYWNYWSVGDGIVFAINEKHFFLQGDEIADLGTFFQERKLPQEQIFIQNEDDTGILVSFFVKGQLVRKKCRTVVPPANNDSPFIFQTLPLCNINSRIYYRYEIFWCDRRMGFCPADSDFIKVSVQDEDSRLYQMYRRFNEDEFVRVYEGKSLIAFNNVVCFFDDKTQLYKLYGFNQDYQMVLWGEGATLEEHDTKVIIGDQVWSADSNNFWILLPEMRKLSEKSDTPKETVEESKSPKGRCWFSRLFHR